MLTRILQALPPWLLGAGFTLRLLLVEEYPFGVTVPLVGVWAGVMTWTCLITGLLALLPRRVWVMHIQAAMCILLAGLTAAYGVAILAYASIPERPWPGWWATRNWFSTGVAFSLASFFLVSWWGINSSLKLEARLKDRSDEADNDTWQERHGPSEKER